MILKTISVFLNACFYFNIGISEYISHILNYIDYLLMHISTYIPKLMLGKWQVLILDYVTSKEI